MSGHSEIVHILLIEDNEGDIFLLARALEHAAFHHRLTVLQDGADAMSFLRRDFSSEPDSRPDLVLLDLNLPRVEGSKILELFRTSSVLQSIPVVLLSSSTAPRDSAKASLLNHCIYIAKPSDLDAYMEIGFQVKAFWEQCRRECEQSQSVSVLHPADT